MMEWDLGCSIDNLYEECKSWFLETIGAELSQEQKDVDNKKLYEAIGGGGRSMIFLLGMGEAKFRFCYLGSVEFVWILIVISWGWKSY